MKGSHLCAIILMLAVGYPCLSQEKPRIAVLQLKNENAGELEASLLSRLVRNYLVNTGHYDVLDREDMDKILRERSLYSEKIPSDTDAAQFGKILNVQKIVVGTLMWLNGAYIIEARLVNVESSSIERSATESCESNDDFERIARSIVGKIVEVREPGQIVDSGSSIPFAVDSPGFVKDKKTQRWVAAGLSGEEYGRFKASGLSETDWARKEWKSPVLAGLLGIVPVTSGSYYTGNYGLAIFLSLVKTLSIFGMFQTWQRHGDDAAWFTAYAVSYSSFTVLDVSSSAIFTHVHNRNMSKLFSKQLSCKLTLSNKPGLAFVITY
jgi:Curli production assembly/transport component CsgG